ncbi:MAG TPA: HAD family hydrolase [Vicinamibacterales bacterium]|nr:HAD family hydrolase [Vicinamibacterales bacterium]
MVTIPRLIVFDIAGTLLDDGGAVLDAFRVALLKAGIESDADDLNAVRGANKLQVFRSFAARALGAGPEAIRAAQEGLATFNEELAIRLRDGEMDFVPGLPETLQRLRDAGLRLASNSGFNRPIAEAVLARLRRHAGALDADVCGDDVPEGRPAPFMIFLAMERTGVHDAKSVVVVGDTPLDLQAGTNAGAGGVVGVMTGTHDWQSLGAVRHTHLIPSVAGLPALLRDDFSVDIAVANPIGL